MERTKPKNAGWRSFRFGFVSDKKKPDEEEHRHTPDTCTHEFIGVGCYCTTIDTDKQSEKIRKGKAARRQASELE